MGRSGLRKRYDPADKVARLVAAAAAVIGERGLAGATVPRIAARAGVSRGLIHYHFPNRHALVQAAAAHHCAQWLGVLRDVAGRGREPETLAREAVAAVRALAAQHPTFWPLRAVLTAAAHHDPVLANTLAAAAREAARSIGPLDSLLCGFACRPEARELDPAAWTALEAAAVSVARAARAAQIS